MVLLQLPASSFFTSFSWCPKVDVGNLISNTHESFSTFNEFPHPQNPFLCMLLFGDTRAHSSSTVHGCEPTVDHPGTLLRSDEFGSKKARTMQRTDTLEIYFMDESTSASLVALDTLLRSDPFSFHLKYCEAFYVIQQPSMLASSLNHFRLYKRVN